jgi:hypothetical protein
MDLSDAERLFVNRFIIKDKQERYSSFLSNKKSRGKFIDKLYHFEDLQWKFFREIPGNENEREIILQKLKSKKSISRCFIISSDPKFDRKSMTVEDAIENVVGTEASILIFGEAEIVYYEGEPPNQRYISL